MSQNLYVAMYHYVRDLKNSRYPEIKGLEYELFKEQVRFLKKEFQIVTMEEVIAAVDGKLELPERAALLTFDDGYIDHFTNAFPVLMEEKVQGSFFIPGKTFVEHKLLDVNKVHFILAAAPVDELVQDLNALMNKYRQEYQLPSNESLFEEHAVANRFDPKEVIYVKRLLQTVLPEKLRNIITSILFEKYVGVPEEKFARELYMNREQILCMKNAGMHIGLHGYDHYWLGNLSKEQMMADTDRALTAMEEFIDKDVWVMNYPYGSYNEQVIAYIAQKGCRLGLTTRVDKAVLTENNRFEVARLDTNDFPPKSSRYLEFV